MRRPGEDFFLSPAFPETRVFLFLAWHENFMHCVDKHRLFCKKATTWRWKKPQSINNLYRRQCLALITKNKMNLSNRVTPIIYTLKKCCLCSYCFCRIVSCFFSPRVKKACSILWSVWVWFVFLEKKMSNKYFLWEVNLGYYM